MCGTRIGGNAMQDYIVHYHTEAGEPGNIRVGTGDTYETILDFIDEFLLDHPGYKITKIEEE